jgi:hypothetical protein
VCALWCKNLLFRVEVMITVVWRGGWWQHAEFGEKGREGAKGAKGGLGLKDFVVFKTVCRLGVHALASIRIVSINVWFSWRVDWSGGKEGGGEEGRYSFGIVMALRSGQGVNIVHWWRREMIEGFLIHINGLDKGIKAQEDFFIFNKKGKCKGKRQHMWDLVALGVWSHHLPFPNPSIFTHRTAEKWNVTASVCASMSPVLQSKGGKERREMLPLFTPWETMRTQRL